VSVLTFKSLPVTLSRSKHVIKNVVPIITCSPWKPVVIRNVDPYAESAIVNGASAYSNACSKV
jgi:hypothetical protein